MSLHRVEQARKDRTTLLDASGDHRPDAFAPAAAFFASRPLRDVPVNDDEANRLLRQVIGRVDTRRRDEAEVRFPVFAEPFGQVACMFRVRHAGGGD